MCGSGLHDFCIYSEALFVLALSTLEEEEHSSARLGGGGGGGGGLQPTLPLSLNV